MTEVFENLGAFSEYIPEQIDPEAPDGAIFFRNELGQDFYDLARTATAPLYFLALPGGEVVSVTDDLTMLSPDAGKTVIAATGAEDLAEAWLDEADLVWDGSEVAVAPIGPDAVNRERDRRVEQGTSITPAGYDQPVRVRGDGQTKQNLTALAAAAEVRIRTGANDLVRYRDDNDIIHSLTHEQIADLGAKFVAFCSAVYNSSWDLKPSGNSEISQVPDDYAADHHWPAA